MTENEAFEDVDVGTERPRVVVLSKRSPLYQRSSLNDQNQVVIPPPPPGVEPNQYQRMLQEGTSIVFEDTVNPDVNNNNNKAKMPVTSQISGFFRKTFKSKRNKLL